MKRMALLLLATPAHAHTITPIPALSWNGYHWSHTVGMHPARVTVGVNVMADPAWSGRIGKALKEWSTGGVVQFTVQPGNGAVGCGYTIGTLQICEGDYGATGWVAYTNVQTAGTTVVQAMIRLNDYYFRQAKWNTEAHKQSIICQEIGNALGLQDVDRSMGNPNKGSCLDYSTHPEAAPSDLAPSAGDLLNLRVMLYP